MCYVIISWCLRRIWLCGGDGVVMVECAWCCGVMVLGYNAGVME